MFEVVNPVILGNFNSKYDEQTPIDAAKHFWNDMSKIVINEIPKTFFSLKDTNGKLYHFKVTEEKSGANMADYMLSQINLPNKKEEKGITETFERIKSASAQKGGRKHDDSDDSSSSSSSSSEDDIVRKFDKKRRKHSHPIVYYHYIPTVYGDESLFMPVFTYPIMPYVEVGFSTAFWG